MTKPTEEQIEALLTTLRGRGWMKGKTLAQLLGLGTGDNALRDLREIVHASKGQVASGPGSPGYCLTCEVKPEELHFMEGIREQRDRMDARYIDIMRVWHGHQTAKAAAQDEPQKELALA